MARIVAIGSLLIATLAGQTAPSGAVLYQNARLIPGDGGSAIERSALLVEGGRITRVGSAASVSAPAGASRVDLTGKTIMPALIGTHVHPGFQRGMSYVAANYIRDTVIEDLNRALFFGVSA